MKSTLWQTKNRGNLKKMDAKDRQSIEDEIARRIRGKIEEQARTES